jgi:Zn-dependent protease with chaperone function
VTIAIALTIALALAPALIAWWTGQRLLRRLDDPALAERTLARSARVTQAFAVALGILAVVNPRALPWALPLMIVSFTVGGFPSRKKLLEERWGVIAYLIARLRMSIAFGGVWVLLALTPALVLSAGSARWVVATALALLLLGWTTAYGRVCFALIGATDVPLPPTFIAIAGRTRAVRPRFLRFGFPGGRIVNAFAFPSVRHPAVLFSDAVLEQFPADEQAAIFAHEMAHLEHHDARDQRRSALVMWAGIAVAAFGVPLASVLLPGHSDLSLLWATIALAAPLLNLVRHKKHEAESDARAVALCGDAEALVRALVRLSVLGRQPRRWSADVERGASHPSLARRVHAVRAVAGVTEPSLASATVAATATAGSFVILDTDRAWWLDGVPTGTPAEPAALREAAITTRSVRYPELVDLRVRASLGGTAALVATDRAGASWSVTLAGAETVAAVQRALDVVDAQFSERPAIGLELSGRLVAAALMAVAPATAAVWTVLVAGAVVIARPARATVSALGVVAVFAGLVGMAQALEVSAMTVVAAFTLPLGFGLAALWLARRNREPLPAREVPAMRVTVIVLGAVALLGAGSAAWYAAGEESLVDALAQAIGAWVALAGAGAAMLTDRRRVGRRAGAGVATIAVAGLAAAVFAPLATSEHERSLAWRDGAAKVMGQVDVGAYAGDLRVAPSGTRFAVKLLARDGTMTPTMRVVSVSGERRDVAADDLQFVDDNRALVAIPGDHGLSVRVLDLAAGTTSPWSATVPNVAAARLAVSPVTGAWSLVGGSSDGENFLVALGKIGDAAVTVSPVPIGEADGFALVYALSPTVAGVKLRVRTGAGPLAWATTVLQAPPVMTEVWRLAPDGHARVARWPRAVHCPMAAAPDGHLLCTRWERGVQRVWLVDVAGAGRVVEAARLPGVLRRTALGPGGRVAAVSLAGEAALVDVARGTAVRFELPSDVGRAVAMAPLDGRLVIASTGPRGSQIRVFDVQ